jgi:conjugative relaxase-like TrwC/TraI family protein
MLAEQKSIKIRLEIRQNIEAVFERFFQLDYSLDERIKRLMLTLGKMTPEQAAIYFEKDNYYQQKNSVEASEWWGDGADEFNLSGHVDLKQFKNLCYGFDPTGKIQYRLPPKNGEAVAGLDCTFSAPKSYSLACLVAGDERLAEAHKKAVKVALEFMRDRIMLTRVKGQRVIAFKPIVAMFEHDTSRELDPQLHTHCFWMNLVQTEDEKWQSLANDLFYEHKIFLGQVYRNELARLCQELGYQIEHRADGLFELAGYTREEILEFSERHNQIMETLAEMGLPDTTDNRIFALFKTRKAKQQGIDRTALKDYWQRNAEKIGIVHPTPGQPIHGAANLEELVGQALRHCEERRSVFAIEAVEKFITESPTGHRITDITKEIATFPGVIQKDNHALFPFGTSLATEGSLEREKRTIALMEHGKGTVVPLAPPIKTEELSADQLAAVNLTLTASDRVLGWVGVAGAGKTHTVIELLKAIDGRATVTGLAPDAAAAQTLEQETGIKASTVASMLASAVQDDTGRKIVVVDEAGKLSAREAYLLLEKSRVEGFQVLLIGDPEQLSAVEAGNPFKALVENGMTTAKLGDFIRQKDPMLNLAVQMLYHDWGTDSLNLLNKRGWITEHRNLEERMSAIAQQWIASDRQNTRVLAGTHLEREAITSLLRAQLKTEGLIGQQDYAGNVLRSKDLTHEQAQHARFYQVGDIVIPGKHHNGLRSSRQYRIAEIKGNIITLLSGSGVATLDMKALKQPLSARVYQVQRIDISTGDRLRWTQNNRMLGRVNGKEFTVMSIEDDIVSLRYDDGKRDQVSLNQLNHLDHGLVRTLYSSQGMTCNEVLIAMGNDQTVSRESILVGMTRAKYKAHFFCTDKATLFERVDRSHTQPNILEWLTEKGFKLKAPEPPTHIDINHWVERIEGSGVLPEVAAINVKSIEEDTVYQYLLETRMEKLGSGQLVTRPMKDLKERYKTVAEGGAWNLGGIDARCLPTLKAGDRPVYKGWGELKPDNPREDEEKTLKKGSPQVRKYEAPLDEPKGIFFPDVPSELANKIFERYGVSPTPQQRESGFWPCVFWYPQIEIHITEGKKKSEADVSQAYAAIGLPSITGGYRSKDEQGNRLARRVLHEELAVFAQSGRRVLFALDEDTKGQTVQDVCRDTVRTGELFEEAGCRVAVIHWKNNDGKGIDDFIVENGPKAWDERIAKAAPLNWEALKHYETEYRKLSGWIQKRYGKAPEPRNLDVAIGMMANPQDVGKILCFSPQIKNTSSVDAEAYIRKVYQEAMKVKQKIDAPKVEAAKPIVRMNF